MSKEKAIEYITTDWEMIDGKHYCPDCYEVEVINGVYNVKAKEK